MSLYGSVACNNFVIGFAARYLEWQTWWIAVPLSFQISWKLLVLLFVVVHFKAVEILSICAKRHWIDFASKRFCSTFNKRRSWVVVASKSSSADFHSDCRWVTPNACHPALASTTVSRYLMVWKSERLIASEAQSTDIFCPWRGYYLQLKLDFPSISCTVVSNGFDLIQHSSTDISH